MPYVYRYKDMIDGKYKYIGIVKGDTLKCLERRIKQHRKDDWMRFSEYLVTYIEVASICDAESIEGHLIALYETYNYYNKAKKNWGLSSLFSMEENGWTEYGVESLHALYEKQISGLEDRVTLLIAENKKYEKEKLELELLEHSLLKHGMESVPFYAIKQNIEEKIERFESWASECKAKTSANKWAYRANRMRYAIHLFEEEILERIYYAYSEEYREDSKFFDPNEMCNIGKTLERAKKEKQQQRDMNMAG